MRNRESGDSRQSAHNLKFQIFERIASFDVDTSITFQQDFSLQTSCARVCVCVCVCVS